MNIHLQLLCDTLKSLDFSDANLCPLNSCPFGLNRLKIIDDILNRLKCQNVKCQKHITEEPIRKHFISMS